MPDYEIKVIIREISRTDLEYITSQIKNAVEICNGKLTLHPAPWTITILNEDDNG